MTPLHLDTPLLESLALSRRAGTRVWLKMDALQPSGSFKIRGLGYACQTHLARGAKKFVCSSGGNAGLAVAHAARRLGVPATIVVPEATGPRAKELIAAEGAEVLVRGQTWQEAHEFAQTLLSSGAAYLHPFDDPLVWHGHASLIDEVLAAGLRPDAVIVAVGGGGLLCGIAAGLKRAGLHSTQLIAAETVGADSYAAALKAGAPVTLERISSIATTLGAKRVAARAVAVAAEHPLSSQLVTDREAVQACLDFADDHRVIVEPACGAALALAYKGIPEVQRCREVLAIVCGGSGVSYDKLAEFKRTLP